MRQKLFFITAIIQLKNLNCCFQLGVSKSKYDYQPSKDPFMAFPLLQKYFIKTIFIDLE